MDRSHVLPRPCHQKTVIARGIGRCPLFCHDGTERGISRPRDPDDQKLYYNGKKKMHLNKA